MLRLENPVVRAQQQLTFLDYVVVPLWAAVGAAFPEVSSFSEPLARHRLLYKAMTTVAIMDGSNACHPEASPEPCAVGRAATARTLTETSSDDGDHELALHSMQAPSPQAGKRGRAWPPVFD
jgi:hypothetical protein